MPGLIISKTFAWLRLKRLPARFRTATASFPKKRDQVPHLLVFLRSDDVLKPAKPPNDSLHRLPCLLGDCGAGDRLRATWNSSAPSLARRTGVLLLPVDW